MSLLSSFCLGQRRQYCQDRITFFAISPCCPVRGSGERGLGPQIPNPDVVQGLALTLPAADQLGAERSTDGRTACRSSPRLRRCRTTLCRTKQRYNLTQVRAHIDPGKPEKYGYSITNRKKTVIFKTNIYRKNVLLFN